MEYDGLISHMSDCARHNEPAEPAGPCDCGYEAFWQWVRKRRSVGIIAENAAQAWRVAWQEARAAAPAHEKEGYGEEAPST